MPSPAFLVVRSFLFQANLLHGQKPIPPLLHPRPQTFPFFFPSSHTTNRNLPSSSTLDHKPFPLLPYASSSLTPTRPWRFPFSVPSSPSRCSHRSRRSSSGMPYISYPTSPASSPAPPRSLPTIFPLDISPPYLLHLSPWPSPRHLPPSPAPGHLRRYKLVCLSSSAPYSPFYPPSSAHRYLPQSILVSLASSAS